MTEISLKNRLLTLACMVAVVIIGFRMFQSAPIDVYPDINPPRITILTEAHGTLIVLPVLYYIVELSWLASFERKTEKL